MQSSWSREKFALNVHVQHDATRLPKTSGAADGFMAVISISLTNAAVPAFPRLMVGDDDGSGFNNATDALTAGIDAANRVVDDLLA